MRRTRRLTRPRGAVALVAAALSAVGLGFVGGVAHAATATATDTGDGYVLSTNTTGNFGTAGNERINGSTKVGYYEFAVSGVPAGATINSATLALTGVGTQTAQTVTVSSTGTFDESTLDWANRPAVGTTRATGTMNTGVTLNANVTGAVTGNGNFAFAVTNAGASDSVIATKETATTGAAPVLTVAYTAAATNTAPVVNAGTDQAVTLPASASLDGTVSDDGNPNPPGAVTTTWSKVSGPGTVTFGNAAAVDTTASFSASGSYVLKLTGNDGALTSSDQVTVTVNPAVQTGPYLPYTPTSYLRAPLPSDWVTTHKAADSAFGISWLMANDQTDQPKLNGVPTTNGGSTVNGWGIGFGLGQCTDPVWHFEAGSNVPTQDSFLLPGGSGFHAPAGWQNHFPSNNDSPIEVIDRCGNSTFPGGFSVWAANVAYSGSNTLVKNPLSNSGGIVGGAFDDTSNGVDHRDSHSNSTLNETSRGNIPESFGIRTDLVQAAEQGANGGTLGHVLQVFLVETNSAAGVSSPMVAAESGQAGCGGAAHPTICAEGQRMAILPTWTPPAGCTGAAKVVALTLQKYGMYIGNNSGSGSAIKVQQDDTTTGLWKNSLASCFTYNDMAFLDKDYSPSW